MGWHNRFFHPEGLDAETPRRLYALFDQREGETLLLEAVDADWFEDSIGPGADFTVWRDRSRDARLSVLEIAERSFRRWNPVQLPHGKDELEDEGPREWIEVTLGAGPEEGLLYLSLFGVARPIGIEDMRAAPANVAAGLDEAFDLEPHVVDEDEIREALDGLKTQIDWVGVYDVGQGAATALCDNHGAPIAYFDLGGGVLANKGTFSNAFTDICTSYEPPVILSHWDWDHWSSGNRFPVATSLTWIVPNQKLGAVHGTFAAAIAANGRLLVWPGGLASLRIGQVEIEKCLGTSGRNHTGLALLVDGPAGEPPILLTGDARYTAIPSGLGNPISVVVPHHGADMRSHSTPLCLGQPAARAAYSYGPSNSFSHPRHCTYVDHDFNSWPHRALTPGSSAIDRHTADRPGGQLGHIALGWSSTAPTPTQGCLGKKCSLQLVQR
jgi:hypothetical protein